MSYMEVFVMGDLSSGSYRCFFTLSDPDGWTWHPGALPEEALIRPPAGTHGTPPLAPVLSSLSHPAELPQRGYENSTNPIDSRRMALWKSYLERRGIKFEIGTPTAELKLFDTNSVGLYALHTRTIYLLHPPNTATFFEESFHALQHLRQHPRRKILDTGQDVDAWEYDAKQAILRHSEKLSVSYEEYTQTEKQLDQVINNDYGDDEDFDY